MCQQYRWWFALPKPKPRERRRPQMPNAQPKMIEERIVVFNGGSSFRPEHWFIRRLCA
jgi:hypothetical protein